MLLVRLFSVVALIAALIYGWQELTGHYIEQGRAEQKAVDQAAVNKLKAEAAAALSLEKDKLIAATVKLGGLISALEEKRDAQQTANAADLAARLAGPKLQFRTTAASGCGRSGGSPPTATASSPSNPETTIVQLPDRINDDLQRLAGKAQSLAIDYGVLYEYVNNPKLVCFLSP